MNRRHRDIMLNIPKKKYHFFCVCFFACFFMQIPCLIHYYNNFRSHSNILPVHLTQTQFFFCVSIFSFSQSLFSFAILVWHFYVCTNTSLNPFQCICKSRFVYASTTRSWCRFTLSLVFAIHTSIFFLRHVSERKKSCVLFHKYFTELMIIIDVSVSSAKHVIPYRINIYLIVYWLGYIMEMKTTDHNHLKRSS